MKNILNRVLPVLAFVMFFSCQETEFPVITEKYVAFTRGATNLNESATTIGADGSVVIGDNNYTVEVLRSTTDFSQPVTVGINVTAVYTKDSDFAAAGDDASDKIVIVKDLSALTIEAGAVNASFVVVAKEDLRATGDVSVTFEIVSVSDNSFKIGQQASAINKVFTLTVVDDDCPIDLAGQWAGEYKVVSICGAPGAFNEGFCEATSKWAGLGLTTMTADASDPLGLTAILSGGFHDDDVPIEFQTCPQTVSLVPGGYNLSITQGSQARILPTDEPGTYGTGVFDPESFKFNLVVSYTNQGGSNFQEFIIEYEKVN